MTGQRTAVDLAHVFRDLVDVRYPEAERSVPVLDNLATHPPAALCAAFPPEGAHRLNAKLEWHYTPKHGSRLNMAEIEFSVLGRQCLDRRMADKSVLKGEVALWKARRNQVGTGTSWRFTTADARIKLKRLYQAVPA